MRWMVVRNFEGKAYIMRRIKGKTEYLLPNGQIRSQPYFYDYFEASKVYFSLVPEHLRQEESTTI
jgi:hypothetical protein